MIEPAVEVQRIATEAADERYGYFSPATRGKPSDAVSKYTKVVTFFLLGNYTAGWERLFFPQRNSAEYRIVSGVDTRRDSIPPSLATSAREGGNRFKD